MRDHLSRLIPPRAEDSSCGPVGLWACGPVGLWACGPVGLWACGPVGHYRERFTWNISPSRIIAELSHGLGLLDADDRARGPFINFGPLFVSPILTLQLLRRATAVHRPGNLRSDTSRQKGRKSGSRGVGESGYVPRGTHVSPEPCPDWNHFHTRTAGSTRALEDAERIDVPRGTWWA